MAATAKAYTPLDVPQGPAELWVDTATPADGARIVLHTDGTPDGLTNPNALFIGKLKDGVKASIKPKLNEFMSDESTAPFRTSLEAEEIMLSGTWMELQNSTKLLRFMSGATRTTGTGYERLTIGGLAALTTYNWTLIWPQFGVTSKWIALQIYSGVCVSGIEISIGRKNAGESPFQIKGLSIDSRTAGDRVYSWMKQI